MNGVGRFFSFFFWEGGSIDRLECKLKESELEEGGGVGAGCGGFAVSGGVGLVVSGDLERERLLRVSIASASASASKKWVVGCGLWGWLRWMGELRGLGFGFWVLVRCGEGGGEEVEVEGLHCWFGRG